jgi:uncharacterized protein with HEPN domain
MSFEPRDYLHHILAEIDFMLGESAGLTAEQFMADATLQRAFARSFEIIGQAAKNVPPEFRQQHTDIDWRSMAGMRDRLIHAYFGVDYDLVWATVRTRLPELRDRISAILEA